MSFDKPVNTMNTAYFHRVSIFERMISRPSVAQKTVCGSEFKYITDKLAPGAAFNMPNVDTINAGLVSFALNIPNLKLFIEYFQHIRSIKKWCGYNQFSQIGMYLGARNERDSIIAFAAELEGDYLRPVAAHEIAHHIFSWLPDINLVLNDFLPTAVGFLRSIELGIDIEYYQRRPDYVDIYNPACMNHYSRGLSEGLSGSYFDNDSHSRRYYSAMSDKSFSERRFSNIWLNGSFINGYAIGDYLGGVAVGLSTKNSSFDLGWTFLRDIMNGHFSQ